MLKNWSDQKIEIIVGQLLRVGVLLSASVVFIGGCIYLVRCLSLMLRSLKHQASGELTHVTHHGYLARYL